MSYCVHCGVELDKTAASCPLCSTPVINPKQAVDKTSKQPFASKKGQVDPIKHNDYAILLSVVLASTAAACGILNFFIFNNSLWSLYIIGACILLWIFFIPALIYSKIPIFINILVDGISISAYVYVISLQFERNDWYLKLALPIIILITILVFIYFALRKLISSSILSAGVYFFTEVGILTVGIDLLIHKFLWDELAITWSGIVLTCCIIIAVTLITIITRSRLREEVRRRMHL